MNVGRIEYSPDYKSGPPDRRKIRVERPTPPPPNPGSPAAQEQGCRCAVMDNHHGRGAFLDGQGRPSFWITDKCPLHGGEAV